MTVNVLCSALLRRELCSASVSTRAIHKLLRCCACDRQVSEWRSDWRVGQRDLCSDCSDWYAARARARALRRIVWLARYLSVVHIGDALDAFSLFRLMLCCAVLCCVLCCVCLLVCIRSIIEFRAYKRCVLISRLKPNQYCTSLYSTLMLTVCLCVCVCV